jgi:exopolysaccharide biosynthesis WecB/TagA/CpsF family protein
MQYPHPNAFTNATPVTSHPKAAPVASVPVLPLFGLGVVDATADAAITAMLAPGKRRVHFLNAHCANMMNKNTAYAATLQTADMVLPDGVGVELALRMKGHRLTANLNGTDFVPALMQAAGKMGLSVYLFGGRPGTAEVAANALWAKAPGLRIAGTRDGFTGAADTDAAIRDINASGADILLVAMGVPMQDLWIAENAHRLAPRLSLGVGALFDFLAGNVSRAPRAVRAAKMEWIWRLSIEPRRMARRYLIGNAAFMVRAARHAFQCASTANMLKRAVDITTAVGALVCLSPVFLAAMAAIKLESRGPVFFTQTRIGRAGVPFPVFKFRSMHIDAEARRTALLETSDRAGICFKSRNDPRVTRIGRLLRRYSIDELPQILNILRGEMSVVGPRPALPQEVAAYPARALGRLAVKPGLTGIWQVSGRAEIGFEKMIDMDLAYAQSKSLLLDMILIALTFRAVLGGRGAY